MTDLRSEDLEKAREWVEYGHGVSLETMAIDALDI